MSTISAVTKAMSSVWKTSTDTVSTFIPNNGLFIGAAPQGTKTLFATWNMLPSKLIMTMGDVNGLQGFQGSNIEDLQIQVSYFSDQKQGLTMAYDLAAYGDSLWHRQPLATMTNTNSVGMYRVGGYAQYWSEREKMWVVVSVFRVMAG